MSLPDFSTQSNLFSMAALSASLFPEGDRYRLFAKLVYPRLAGARSALESCYCAQEGRPALEPVLMLGVSVLQELDGIPDRQAVEMLRYHGGWNFALNRQLGDPLFHPTTLVNFRQRLEENEQSTLAFRTILDGLVEAGLVSRRSRQRLDSMQMFGRVSRMSRLDCVRESLRLTLEELAGEVEASACPIWWKALWERYVETQVNYRASSETLIRKLGEAGADAWQLLEWLRGGEQANLAARPQAQLLRRVFGEQFEMAPGSAAPQLKNKEQLSSKRVRNPHDPEATYAAKGSGEQKKEHVGYKVQVAETVSEAKLKPGEPTGNFLTGIVAHAAYESDEAGAVLMEAEQEAMGLEKPPVQYVDGAYISAEKLVEAQAGGREIIGPAPGAPHNNAGRFTTEDFQITVEERQAICPAGQQNTQCSRLQEAQSGKVTYRFEWSTVCADCSLREKCVAPNKKHRTIVVGEHHTALQTRRKEQKNDTFKERLKHRNAIEGTQSELVRAHGLRHAHYRGLAKTKLQCYLAGAACNIKRWIRREAWKLQQTAAAVTMNPQAAS
jgi:transposase